MMAKKVANKMGHIAIYMYELINGNSPSEGVYSLYLRKKTI